MSHASCSADLSLRFAALVLVLLFLAPFTMHVLCAPPLPFSIPAQTKMSHPNNLPSVPRASHIVRSVETRILDLEID